MIENQQSHYLPFAEFFFTPFNPKIKGILLTLLDIDGTKIRGKKGKTSTVFSIFMVVGTLTIKAHKIGLHIITHAMSLTFPN